MSFSRLGVIVFLGALVAVSTGCEAYNRILTRKDVVDGSTAYKERKFAEAEELFRKAAARDPEGKTEEGKIAQLFLARTLHSRFIGDRQKREYAEQAIAEYKKALQNDPNEQSAYKAVASLLDTPELQNEWRAWVTERANNEGIRAENRAEALTSLAARENTCSNEITDTEATKKPGKRDGQDVFIFVKPEKPEDLERLKQCVTRGTEFAEKAAGLEPPDVEAAKNLDVTTLSLADLNSKHELIKIFESARSYKAALLNQSARLAEMEGRNDDAARLRTETEAARLRFNELSQLNKTFQTEKDRRIAIERDAENANANAGK
jgi:tetratricopeptide (TPR) repeat protein